MTEERIREIYRDARILTKLKEIIRLLHIGNDNRASVIWNDLIADWDRICRSYEELSAGAGNRLMGAVKLAVRAGKDYLAFGDVIEGLLLPEFQRYLKSIGNIHVEEGSYELTSSDAGYLALYDKQNDCLIHAYSDPMENARVMAESLYQPEYEEYCILGAGLGYLAYQLYKISEGSARIRVYETEKKIQAYAKQYGVLDWIPRSNLYIERDTDILKFLRYVDENEVRCVISDWVLPYIPRNERSAISNLMLVYSIERNVLETNFSINFWNNMSRSPKFTKDIPKADRGDEFIVVAAGPSLDQSMDFLTAHYGEMPIIAVGTVFRKLLRRGIVPDFVAILESHELVYEQLRGLEEQQVPIIMPLCGYWKIGERYQGDVYYYASCEDEESVKYARENNLELWEVGGTVSYTALVAAVRFGAKKIYMLGLDLAYPDARSHAEDTPQYREVNVDGYIEVEKVGGGKVFSDKPFAVYREAIEGYIAAHKELSFYNLSKIGSRIKGAIEI